MGQFGYTPAPIAAHLRLTAIGIKEPPLKMGFRRTFYQYQAIRPYREAPAADLTDKSLHFITIQALIPIIYEDKIIPTSTHFIERYFLHKSIHLLEQG
jgi:hypothetical protein